MWKACFFSLRNHQGPRFHAIKPIFHERQNRIESTFVKSLDNRSPLREWSSETISFIHLRRGDQPDYYIHTTFISNLQKTETLLLVILFKHFIIFCFEKEFQFDCRIGEQAMKRTEKKIWYKWPIQN